MPPSAAEGPRHSPGWYDQAGEWDELAVGDRMLIPCEGGTVMSRLEVYPPRLEVPADGGLYVLDDAGPRPTWRYLFVPT